MNPLPLSADGILRRRSRKEVRRVELGFGVDTGIRVRTSVSVRGFFLCAQRRAGQKDNGSQHPDRCVFRSDPFHSQPMRPCNPRDSTPDARGIGSTASLCLRGSTARNAARRHGPPSCSTRWVRPAASSWARFGSVRVSLQRAPVRRALRRARHEAAPRLRQHCRCRSRIVGGRHSAHNVRALRIRRVDGPIRLRERSLTGPRGTHDDAPARHGRARRAPHTGCARRASDDHSAIPAPRARRWSSGRRISESSALERSEGGGSTSRGDQYNRTAPAINRFRRAVRMHTRSNGGDMAIKMIA